MLQCFYDVTVLGFLCAAVLQKIGYPVRQRRIAPLLYRVMNHKFRRLGNADKDHKSLRTGDSGIEKVFRHQLGRAFVERHDNALKFASLAFVNGDGI